MSKLVIFLNGEARQLDDTTSLSDLVKAHGLHEKSTLIELNGEAIVRREWSTRFVEHGDRLEFLKVVAGG